MPTYNRAFCITDAIDNVLSQSYKNFELIIVDDGSNDNTDKLIQKTYAEEIKSGKIVYKKLVTNMGVCHARNEALKIANNEWIAYCDTDNKMLSNHLKSFADAIIENPRRLTFYARIKHRNSGREYGKPFNYSELTQDNFIDMGVFVHNISLYKKYGGFDKNLKRLVDWDLILTYTKNNAPVYIDKILLDYNDDTNMKRITNTENRNLNYIRKKHKIKKIKEKRRFKIFDKEKLEKGRRHIYLFGIKMFSYKRKNKNQTKHFCPICQKHSIFLNMNSRKDAICQLCGSFERDRVLFYIYKKYFLDDKRKISLLHMAPEKCLYEILSNNKDIKYVCSDLFPELFPFADGIKKEDAMNLSFPDKSFDVIISSHVLEHVPNAKGFIKESLRVLKDDGMIFCAFPRNTQDKSFEDPKIINPTERKRLFGQEDHVRLLGTDALNYLNDNSYKIEELKIEDLFSKEIIDTEKLNDNNDNFQTSIIIIRKK